MLVPQTWFQFCKHDSLSSAAGPLHVLCMETSSARWMLLSLILFLSLLERHHTRESVDYRASSSLFVFNTLLCFIFFMALLEMLHIFFLAVRSSSPPSLWMPQFRKACVFSFTAKPWKVWTTPSLQTQHHSMSFEERKREKMLFTFRRQFRTHGGSLAKIINFGVS